MIRIAYRVLEILVCKHIINCKTITGDNYYSFAARLVAQRSGKGSGWAPAVTQPLRVSLSPSLGDELHRGAEAPDGCGSEAVVSVHTPLQVVVVSFLESQSWGAAPPMVLSLV